MRQALAARVPDAELRLLAPQLTGAHWQHAWDVDRGLGMRITPVPADDSTAFARELDAVVIGGGGIVSPSPAFRPFLLGSPDRWPAEVPAAWSAVCSQNQPSWAPAGAAGRAVVRACCERLAYVSVRNRTTERYVRACGYAGPLHVVPDLVFGLRLEPEPAIVAEVDAVLIAAGIEPGSPLVGIAVGRALGDTRAHPFFRELFTTLKGITQAPGGPAAVVFPFGAVYDDTEQSRIAAEALGVPCLPALSPLALWELVSRLELAVCTRLHGMLIAFAQHVPFVVLDEYVSNELGTSKIQQVTAEAGLERLWLSPFLPGSPGWKLQAAWDQRAAIDLASPAAEARAALERHWTTLVGALFDRS